MSDEKCPNCNHSPHSGLCGKSDGFTPSGCRCVFIPPAGRFGTCGNGSKSHQGLHREKVGCWRWTGEDAPQPVETSPTVHAEQVVTNLSGIHTGLLTPAASEGGTRYYLIKYEDQDRADELFSDERIARRVLAKRLLNWSCHLFIQEPYVASVEGQRTGEPHKIEGRGELSAIGAENGRQASSGAGLKAPPLRNERPSITSSVPDVEGMGAREYAEIWAGFKGPASIFVEGKTLDPLAPWQVAIAVRFAEAFHKQASSLRGAGGEREPDATTIAKAIAYWRDRALAAEDENLRLKLLSDHVECYWDLEDPDCSIESPETYASENGLKVGDEFTLQAAQYWPVQFVVKKTFTDEETDDDWEVEEVGKKRADFPDYITIKARAEASESREQALEEAIVRLTQLRDNALTDVRREAFIVAIRALGEVIPQAGEEGRGKDG